jgi:transposase InsO family protein
LDHGSQYTSDHFLKQHKYWGITASFAFTEQPQAGGCVEKFFRKLKEQVIYGKVFRNLEEVRQAVAEFVYLYNRQWLTCKNGYLSPMEMRKAYYEGKAA